MRLAAQLVRHLCTSAIAARSARRLCAPAGAAASSGGSGSRGMADDVIDLVSPPARPRRRRRTSDTIDLTGPSPEAMAAAPPARVEALVLSDEDNGELAVPLAERLGLRAAAGASAAARPRGRSRSRSPQAPAAAAAAAAAALNAAPLPPRRLPEAGSIKDLRKRGLLATAPSGRLLCRWCRREISFCSAACLHEHQLRSDPGYARKVTFERDAGRCSSCGLHAHLLYLGAAAAPAGCGLPAARRRGMHRWAPNATLKAALKAHAATQGVKWRASEGGRPKARAALLLDAARAAVAHAAAHVWPPAIAAALAAADADAGAPPELLAALAADDDDDEGGDDGGEDGDDADAEGGQAAAGGEAERARLATQLATWLRANGFHTAARQAQLQAGAFWQMDHATPVAEGGGSCGEDNLRTLCTPCHAAATRDLAARLASTRRQQRVASTDAARDAPAARAAGKTDSAAAAVGPARKRKAAKAPSKAAP